MKESNFEILFDIFEEVIQLMYKSKKDNYLNLLLQAANDISAGEVNYECDDETKLNLQTLYENLEEVDFTVDEIRSAFMMHLLRAYKDLDQSVSHHTPDKIALVMSFIALKLIDTTKKVKILDINVSTGNLLLSFLNLLKDVNLNVFAVDENLENAKITAAIANLLDYEVNIYNQNPTTTYFTNMDLIISDLNNNENCLTNISYHLNSLREDAYMIVLVPSSVLGAEALKNEILEYANLSAIINFANDTFKNESRSIMIIQKTKEKKKTLLTELPSISKQIEFTKKILEIQEYFEN